VINLCRATHGSFSTFERGKFVKKRQAQQKQIRKQSIDVRYLQLRGGDVNFFVEAIKKSSGSGYQ